MSNNPYQSYSFQDTTLYTYDTLNQFVSNYNGEIAKIKKKAEEEGGFFHYYHFEYSPNGIQTTDVGRIPSSIITSCVNNRTWTQYATPNTPDAFKMDMGKTYLNTKKANVEYASNKSETVQTPGLAYKIISFQNQIPPFSDFLMNESIYINSFTDASNNIIPATKTATPTTVTSSKPATPSTKTPAYSPLNAPTAITLDPTLYNQIDPDGILVKQLTAVDVSSNKYVPAFGCEWYGYFYPNNGLGTYTFSISGMNDSNGSIFMVWFDDKAVCEYVGENSDLNNNRASVKIDMTESKYYPIRIQMYVNLTQNLQPQQINITLNIEKNGTKIKNNSCLYRIVNKGGSTYYPKLLYYSFVSKSPSDYRDGLFNCYYYDTSTMTYPTLYDSTQLYSIINKHKFRMRIRNSEYGFNLDPLEGVVDYGTLPDGTKWTPVDTSNNYAYPYVYSLYRLNVDMRMGKTFQFDQNINKNGDYDMREVNPSFLQNASSYTELPNYYPNIKANVTQAKNGNSVNQGKNISSLNGEDCKNLCNNDISNCSYYFTYTTFDGNPRCFVDVANSEPTFNQIPPLDSTGKPYINGSLFLREKGFVPPKCPGMSMNSDGLVSDPDAIQFKTVRNTEDYSTSFQYANYSWDASHAIVDSSSIGICDPNIIKRSKPIAYDILFKNATYSDFGKTRIPSINFNKEGMTPLAPASAPASAPSQTPLAPNTSPFQMAPFSFAPSVGVTYQRDSSSVITDAMKDTANSIRAGQYNEQQLAKMMKEINSNYTQLTNQKIPKYEETKAILESNPDYDYSGKTLLYYNSQPVPTIDQQRAIDADQGVNAQTPLYVLGSLTAATLLVMALVIGRE